MSDISPDPSFYAHEAEQSVLGSILLNGSVFGDVAEIVSATDFRTEDHVEIFRAMSALALRQVPIDLTTVAESLRRPGDREGRSAYLVDLVQGTPSGHNVLHYAEIVREKSLCRRMDALGKEISKSARESGVHNVEQLLSSAADRLVTFMRKAAPWRQIHASTAGELMELELPQLETLLSPWLCEKNLVMVHAKRGVGKTHFALGCAYAIASGGRFLEWMAPRPREVLYLDGEMPAQVMQQRLREVAASKGKVPALLRIVTPDIQQKAMPDLATSSGQAEIDSLINPDTALIVVDNLSCLVRSGGAENESESWTTVAEWALRHRRAGRAVMFVHHSGKGGAQRGTSRREDLLDVVIGLRRPSESGEQDGATFEIHFEKARSLVGEAISPIEATLQQDPLGEQCWAVQPVTSATKQQVIDRWEIEGMTIIEVARELGINKSTAARHLQAAMADGELKRPYPTRKARKFA